MRFLTFAAVLALLVGVAFGARAQSSSSDQSTSRTMRTHHVTTRMSHMGSVHHTRHMRRMAHRQSHHYRTYRGHSRMHVSEYGGMMAGVPGMQVDYNVPGAPGSNPPPTEPNAANDGRGLPYTPSNSPSK